MAGCFRYLRKKRTTTTTTKAIALSTVRAGNYLPKLNGYPPDITTNNGPYITDVIFRGGAYYAVGYAINPYNSAVYNGIIRSLDNGLNWTVVKHSAFSFAYPQRIIMLASGRLVVTSYTSSNSGGLNISDDEGITWVSKSVGVSMIMQGLACDNNNVVIATGNISNGTYYYSRSTDGGSTWVSAVKYVSQVAYGNNVWIMTPISGSSPIQRSIDSGATWSTITAPIITAGGTNYLRYIWDTFVVYSNNSNVLWFSTDGLTWTSSTAPGEMTAVRGVTYDVASNSFVIIGTCPVTRVFGVLNKTTRVMTKMAYSAAMFPTSLALSAFNGSSMVFFVNSIPRAYLYP